MKNTNKRLMDLVLKQSAIIKKLQDENDSLNFRYNACKHTIDEYGDYCIKLEQDILIYEDQISDLQCKLDDFESECHYLEERCDELEDTNERLRGVMGDAIDLLEENFNC